MHTNIYFIAALKPFSAFYMGLFYSMKMMQQPNLFLPSILLNNEKEGLYSTQ